MERENARRLIRSMITTLTMTFGILMIVRILPVPFLADRIILTLGDAEPGVLVPRKVCNEWYYLCIMFCPLIYLKFWADWCRPVVGDEKQQCVCAKGWSIWRSEADDILDEDAEISAARAATSGGDHAAGSTPCISLLHCHRLTVSRSPFAQEQELLSVNHPKTSEDHSWRRRRYFALWNPCNDRQYAWSLPCFLFSSWDGSSRWWISVLLLQEINLLGLGMRSFLGRLLLVSTRIAFSWFQYVHSVKRMSNVVGDKSPNNPFFPISLHEFKPMVHAFSCRSGPWRVNWILGSMVLQNHWSQQNWSRERSKGSWLLMR